MEGGVSDKHQRDEHWFRKLLPADQPAISARSTCPKDRASNWEEPGATNWIDAEKAFFFFRDDRTARRRDDFGGASDAYLERVESSDQSGTGHLLQGLVERAIYSSIGLAALADRSMKSEREFIRFRVQEACACFDSRSASFRRRDNSQGDRNRFRGGFFIHPVLDKFSALRTSEYDVSHCAPSIGKPYQARVSAQQ